MSLVLLLRRAQGYFVGYLYLQRCSWECYERKAAACVKRGASSLELSKTHQFIALTRALIFGLVNEAALEPTVDEMRPPNVVILFLAFK